MPCLGGKLGLALFSARPQFENITWKRFAAFHGRRNDPRVNDVNAPPPGSLYDLRAECSGARTCSHAGVSPCEMCICVTACIRQDFPWLPPVDDHRCAFRAHYEGARRPGNLYGRHAIRLHGHTAVRACADVPRVSGGRMRCKKLLPGTTLNKKLISYVLLDLRC
jgi:hypothetical protein